MQYFLIHLLLAIIVLRYCEVKSEEQVFGIGIYYIIY